VAVGYHRAMEDRAQHDAFVALHGERLLGFGLLVTLGDRGLATMLSAEALAAGADRIGQLRHPERAAAWLRARLTKAARGPAWGQRRPSDPERREALRALGVEPAAYDALASLDVRGRAAIAASAVEGLTAADVHEIVGSDDRVRRARRDYLTAYVAASRIRNEKPPAGTLTNRVNATAAPVRSRSKR
jgi:hypothetical protein